MLTLQEILNGEESALEKLKTDLCQKGWSFVQITPELGEVIKEFRQQLIKFFSCDVDEKDKFTEQGTIFGYQRVNHKESFRWLTKERFNKDNKPPVLQQQITALTNFMDNLMCQLMDSTCTNFFKKSPEELGSEFDLALTDPSKENQRFGMLDVAHYLNLPRDGSEKMPLMNCVEHYDPGLFSLSFYSSQPGLELLDLQTNEWVDGPCNSLEGNEHIAVIWCGAAASKVCSEFKPAVHRVRYPEQTDGSADTRMAIWYEICTSAQETDYLNFNNTKKLPPNILVNENSLKHAEEEVTFNPTMRNAPSKPKPEKMAPRIQMAPPQKTSRGIVGKLKSWISGSSVESEYGVPESKVDYGFDPFLDENFESKLVIPPSESKSKSKSKHQLTPEFEFGVPLSKVIHLPLQPNSKIRTFLPS